MKKHQEIIFIGIILLGIVSLVLLTLMNYRYAVQNPGGSDFVIRWVSARQYLMEGWSPYSDETTRAIQMMFYGRLARPDEDQVLFMYPMYSMIVFAPYAIISDYSVARALWMTTLEVGVLLLTAAGLSLARWSPKSWLLALLFIFTILWYYSIRTIINGNVGLLVGLFLAGAFLAIRSEQDGLAGFLLVLSSVKPPLVVLVIPFVLLWALSHRRWPLIWSTLGSFVLIVSCSIFLLPDWLWSNLQQIFAYPDIPGTPRAIFTEWFPGVGNQAGLFLSIVLAGILIWEWRAALNKDFNWFYWAACLTLAITNLIGIRTATENYLVMLPALILVFAAWDQSWGVLGRVLVVVTMLVMFFGLWWLFLATIEQGDQPIQSTVMFLPLPFFLLFGLYWVRWWVLRSKRPLLEQLRQTDGSFRY
ncbi:MAG: DUF2029 domain-containing protein [Anaerolineales bacterium]|nr:DUF2029 domain-containing protein [Anaerolineales bacterium]